MSAVVLARLLRDRSGASAVEFALIAPVLAAMALLAWQGWAGASSILEMRRALDAGAHYVMRGSAQDAAAREVVRTAWTNRPADAVISVDRRCACGSQTAVCTTLCADQTPPMVLVTLRAQGTGRGVFAGERLQRERVLRVR